MSRRTPFVVLRIATGIIFAAAAIPIAEPASTPAVSLDHQFTQVVRPFVTQYCVACHSGNTPAAGFDLASYTTMDMAVRDNARWAMVIDKLTAKQMPPTGMP